MLFRILSRAKAKKLSYGKLENDCVIISITDVGHERVCFHKNKKIKAVLRLSFDDVGDGELNAMSEDDARKIVLFVCRLEESVKEIIVHCEVGVSRSAGICAALMSWLNGDDKPVFDNPNFHPNMHCYRLLLDAITLQKEYENAVDKLYDEIFGDQTSFPADEFTEKTGLYEKECEKLSKKITGYW